MQQSKTKGLLAALLAVALGIASCDRKTIYTHYEHVASESWEKVDTIHFDIAPITQAGTYQETLGLRITDNYPFLGLTLSIEQTIYPKGERHTYRQDCKLIDQEGNAKGSGLTYFQYDFHVSDLNLSEGDSLHITVVHNMKREILPGICDIGIQLTKH